MVMAIGQAASRGVMTPPEDRRSRAPRFVLIAVALVVVLLGLGSVLLVPHAPRTGGRPRRAPSGQAVFSEDLKNDQESLDRGVLAYTALGALATGAQTDFNVTITDIGRRPTAGTVARFPGWIVDPQDVPVGGIVSVRATCDNTHIACQSQSPARQAVLPGSDPGSWTWTVTMLSPGTGRITLTVTTYDQDTQIVLHEAAPIEIATPVHATAGYDVASLAKTTAGLLRWIGPALLFAGAAALWRYRKRRKTAPVKAGAPPGARDPEPAAVRESARDPEPAPASAAPPQADAAAGQREPEETSHDQTR
jgi:hypothetical protein